jgi:CDP-diacylglycerol--glycerol-3-phosphate 3-phosphatidyltransferase
VPTIYQLKPKFQALLRPLTNALARNGVTANHITILAVVLSFVVGGCIAAWPQHRWPLLALAVTLLVRMALNAIDGMLAREHGQKSALGGILNELGDVFSDSALYLPLARVAGFDPFLVVAAVPLAVISEMAGVVGVQIGASRRYDGPFGKSDRAFVFGAIGLLLGLGVPMGVWIRYVLLAIVVLLLLTILNRARNALRELKPQEKKSGTRMNTDKDEKDPAQRNKDR